MTLPFFLIQAWKFIAPGLYIKERKFFLFFLITSPALFLAGIIFAYFFVIPLAWSFFIQFEILDFSKEIALKLEARVSEYLSITIQILLAFGVSFQLPIIITLLGKIGFLTSSYLRRIRRYAFIIILIISSILTPPDVISMLSLSLPIYILYEISILIVSFLEKQSIKKV